MEPHARGGACSNRPGHPPERNLDVCRFLFGLVENLGDALPAPVSVATFWASSHNSLFWADAVSKALCACAADKVKTSVTDLPPKRWAKKSIAEAVLAFEVSMTLSP